MRYARNYEHAIIDTQARPSKDDLKLLAGGCDLLVLPSMPDSLPPEALLLTVGALREPSFNAFNKIMLTIGPPKPSRDAEEARGLMQELELPMFDAQIQRLVAYQRAALRACLPTRSTIRARSRVGEPTRRREGRYYRERQAQPIRRAGRGAQAEGLSGARGEEEDCRVSG